MDRFSWSVNTDLCNDEQLIAQAPGVRIYDGESKTPFDAGKLILTTHRLLWKDDKNQKCILALALNLAILAEEQRSTSSFSNSSPKIALHLSASPPNKPAGPVSSSTFSYIRFSFKEGGEKDFYKHLTEALQQQKWSQPSTVQPTVDTKAAAQPSVRMGIAGIEKNLQKKSQETDKTISQSFEDLSKLMEKAKEMVTLSKVISDKIRDKQGDITEDETVRFKSYLLSLGIADPVTRDTHGDRYHVELAKQIATVMEQPLKECGGTMTLTDVYCRVNRARGLELLSPEDLYNACLLMESVKLSTRLKTFDSGVLALQLTSLSDEETTNLTASLLEKHGPLTAQDFAKHAGLNVILSKERLLSAESAGKACRDDSIEGLRFYPNLFVRG